MPLCCDDIFCMYANKVLQFSYQIYNQKRTLNLARVNSCLFASAWSMMPQWHRTFPLAANNVTGPWYIATAALIYNPCLNPALSFYNMTADLLDRIIAIQDRTLSIRNIKFVLIVANFCAISFFDWHIGWAEARENDKTGPRPLHLVGKLLSVPQSPVLTRSTSAEGKTEACGLILWSCGFTAYQCVQANVRSLNQHPSINYSLCVTGPAPLLVTWLPDKPWKRPWEQGWRGGLGVCEN